MSIKDKPTGSFGEVAAFSFNGNKIVTSGGGGAITTNNIEYRRKSKILNNNSKTAPSFEYIHNELGYNFRMPNLNAALACAQLEQLELYLN